MRIALAHPVIVMMIAIAKAAQYASVDAFGAELGFDLASLLGAGPVLVFYYWVAVRFPKLNTYGLSRG